MPSHLTSQFVVTEPGACRLIALNAWAAWQGTPVSRKPEPGDLVLETTTAFRWIGDPRVAPGEALGWLLRIDEEEGRPVHVLRPIYEDEGAEFRWANASFIRVHTEMRNAA